MPAVFEIPIRVEQGDIDEQGHVSNLCYVAWMLNLAVCHSDAQGWPGRRYRDRQFGWVVRSHHVDYLKPAFLGDRIVGRTWVATMSKITSLRRYNFLNEATGDILVRAETNWAFIDATSLAPRRIPPEVRNAFEVVSSEP